MNFYELSLNHKKYPKLLSEIDSAPKIIYVIGEFDLGDSPTVAIVGTRKATKDGLDLARKTANELTRAGVTVISGLAMGVDTAAHKGALEKNGKTIAVLGSGIDEIYPAQNERLAKDIVDKGGAIISEYGPGEPSYKYRFIERNRIISGLSWGVVVIEAPEKSGAIATARFAAEQGRNVFVFPSTPNNKQYAGSHELIRDGATLVTKTDEILEDLDIKTKPNREEVFHKLGASEMNIISALGRAGKPLDIDTIIEVTTLEPQVVSNAITILVMEGIIKEGSRGYEISNS